MKENNNVWRVFSVFLCLGSACVYAESIKNGNWVSAVLFLVFTYLWMEEVRR